MSRAAAVRLAAVALMIALSVLAAWLMPRVLATPDRFGVAMRLIAEGRGNEAVHLLDSHAWRGVAEYRAGRYQRALYEFVEEETVANLYNMGNSYARMHDWAGAKSAYRRALRLDPGHKDATFNLALVERAEMAKERLTGNDRITRQMGRWEDSDGSDPDNGAKRPDEAEEGDAGTDARHPSARRTGQAGATGPREMPGEEPFPDDPQSGATGGTASDLPPGGVETGDGRALILRESAQAAEVLLRRIRDDPARVLAARLRTAHERRRQAEGACAGC